MSDIKLTSLFASLKHGDHILTCLSLIISMTMMHWYTDTSMDILTHAFCLEEVFNY